MNVVHARTHARTHARIFAMKPIYREVVADFDRRIARLQGIRDQVAAVAELDDDVVEERRIGRGKTRRGRVKPGAGDQVVLAAIGAGADTFPKVVAAAKVSSYVARQAIKRLKAAGKMFVEGATFSARYRVRKKK